MEQAPHGPIYQTHSGSVYQSVENRNPWLTGYIRRLPVPGLLAILGAILGMAACAAVLVVSDGQPISHWKFQPTVYLAIASTLTNIFLAFALSEGADIAWWRKASREKTTVADLHRVWAHSHSFKDALLSGRNVTLVAAACLLATIAQINSPLLQRASTVAVDSIALNTQVYFRAVRELPRGYTGYLSGRENAPSLYTPGYGDVVQAWNTNASIPTNSTGCEGLCYTRVKAMGLVVNCSSYKVPFDLTPKLNNGSLVTSDPSVTGINVFRSSVLYNPLRETNMTIQVIYKGTSECKGDLTVEQCMLQTGVMEYPVVIDGNKSTISLDTKTGIFDDKVEQLKPLPLDNGPGASTMGGYYLALYNKYFSNVTMRFTAAVPYTILTTGNTALQYVVVSDVATPFMNCTTSFRSPLTDILNGARDLMFRTSMAAVNFNGIVDAPLQTVPAIDTQPRAVYRSNYVYLGAALAITLIAMTAILSIFRGYAEIGRHPTMSPIEIAKAFNAPLLQNHDSNAEAEDLVRDVGKRKVRYGAVQESPSYGAGFGMAQQTEYKPFDPHVQEVNMNARRRLAMADESAVRKPETGETFAG